MITYKAKKYSVSTYLIGKYVTISEIDSRINVYYNITDFVCHHEISDRYLNYRDGDLKEIIESDVYRNKTEKGKFKTIRYYARKHKFYNKMVMLINKQIHKIRNSVISW